MYKILNNLEAIILLETTKKDATNIQPEEMAEILKVEEDNIKERFRHLPFRMVKDLQIRLFINQFQENLIRLANLLLPEVPNHKVLYRFMENLLNWLAASYASYFDKEMIIPVHIGIRTVSHLQTVLEQLERKNTLSRELHQLICAPVLFYIQNPQSITFHRHEYIQQYAQTLWQDYPQTPALLKLKLVYLNYNSVAAFRYWVSEIKQELNQLPGVEEKITKLLLWHKEINQASVSTISSFDPSKMPLCKMLALWINEETIYLEKQHRPSVSKPLPAKEPSLPVGKIETNLTVSQLTFFLRLLIESETINHKMDKQLLDLITANVRTRKTGIMSSDSLRNSYYKIEDTSVETIKKQVLKMLNLIQKYQSSMIILLYSLPDYAA
jgi:hypothetical protein